MLAVALRGARSRAPVPTILVAQKGLLPKSRIEQVFYFMQKKETIKNESIIILVHNIFSYKGPSDDDFWAGSRR